MRRRWVGQLRLHQPGQPHDFGEKRSLIINHHIRIRAGYRSLLRCIQDSQKISSCKKPSAKSIFDYATAFVLRRLRLIPSSISKRFPAPHAHPTSHSFTCYRILHIPPSSLPHLPPPRTGTSTSFKAPQRLPLALSQTLSFPSHPIPGHASISPPNPATLHSYLTEPLLSEEPPKKDVKGRK